MEYHKFADGLQIYTSYYPDVPDDRGCSTQRHWMIQHKLMLNDEKTEFMGALSPHHLRKCGLPKNLVVGGATIKPLVSARNLAAHFDTHMSCSKLMLFSRSVTSI